MDFPPIPDDFGSMDGTSFNFDNFNLRTDGAEAMQSGAGTSQSDSHPPRLSRGDAIPIVYSLEIHAWTIDRGQVNPCLLSL